MNNKQSGVVLVISLIILLAITLIGITGSNVTGLEEKMAANNKDKNIAFQAAESALRYVETTVLATNPQFDCTRAGTNQGTKGLYYSITTTAWNPTGTNPASPIANTVSYYQNYTSPSQFVTPAANPNASAYSSTIASTPAIKNIPANWFTNASDGTTCGTNTATASDQWAIYPSSAPSLGNICRNPRYIIEKIAAIATNSSSCNPVDPACSSRGTTIPGVINTYRITVQGWGSNANSTAQVQSVFRITYSASNNDIGGCPTP